MSAGEGIDEVVVGDGLDVVGGVLGVVDDVAAAAAATVV